ncbi:hypothetical protein B0H19DRAFT_431925 [Mycena capillaripes]|nr:hypothetical protein B0H19DRAFT_431925 [Mycena capillaripes]
MLYVYMQLRLFLLLSLRSLVGPSARSTRPRVSLRLLELRSLGLLWVSFSQTLGDPCVRVRPCPRFVSPRSAFPRCPSCSLGKPRSAGTAEPSCTHHTHLRPRSQIQRDHIGLGSREITSLSSSLPCTDLSPSSEDYLADTLALRPGPTG